MEPAAADSGEHGTIELTAELIADGVMPSDPVISPDGRWVACTPVLIVHGEKDTNVPVGQAVNFHRAISQFSTGHELVIYPREGHGFKERDHQLDLLRRSRAWFDRWLLP